MCVVLFFPENFKLADVTPIFKKKDKAFIENYRPLQTDYRECTLSMY